MIVRLLLACLTAVAAVIALSGCAILGEAWPLDPNSPAVSAGRDAARTEAVALARALTPTGRDLGTAHLDGCESGQNNWKVKDPYQHRCWYVAGSAVALPQVLNGVAAAKKLASEKGCVAVTNDPFADAESYYREANGNRTTAPYQRDVDLPTGFMTCGDFEVEYSFLNPLASESSGVELTKYYERVVSQQDFPAPTRGAEHLIIVVQVAKKYYEQGW